MYYDIENGKEYDRSEAAQAVSASGFDGDIEQYLDDVEAGKYGKTSVQVGCNVYWEN